MKDRNKQERSIPRHSEDKKKTEREGFRGSSRTGRQESVRPDKSESGRDRSEPHGNRDLEQ